MMSNDFRKYYGKLFSKYSSSVKNSVMMTLISIFFLIIFLSIFPSQEILYNLGLNRDHILLILFFIVIVFFIFERYLSKKQKKYLLTIEEISYIYVYQSVENLESYIETERYIFLKKASRNLFNLLIKINGWSFGNLKFIERSIGITISDFINNFDNRVFTILEKGDKKELKELINFLYCFLGFLKKEDQKYEDFIDIYKRLVELESPSGIQKISLFDKVIVHIERTIKKLFVYSEKITLSKRILYGLGFILIPIIVGILVYLIGVYVIIMERSAAYQTAVAAFAVSFVPIFTICLNKIYLPTHKK